MYPGSSLSIPPASIAMQASRIIHKDELSAQPEAEIVFSNEEIPVIEPGFEIISTPGHTRGHSVLLYQEKFLFTGDHLYFDRDTELLDAFKDYCWYSWKHQTESMEKLSHSRFEWVLPGHGDRVHMTADKVREQMYALVQSMKDSARRRA